MFLSIEDDETLHRANLCRAAFGYVGGIFPKSWSSFVAKKFIVCGSSGFCMSFFSSKKAEMMHRGFSVLYGRTDASAIPKAMFTQPVAPPLPAIEDHSELFCFSYSTHEGEEAFVQKIMDSLKLFHRSQWCYSVQAQHR